MAETFTHEVAGVGELRFAHLDLYDVFGDPAKPETNGFVPTDRRRKRRQLIEDLTDAGVDQLQRLAELAEFSRKELGLADFLDYLAAPTATAAVVRFAYAKANPDKAMPALPPGAESDVLWALLAPLGILPRKAAADESSQTYGDGGGDPANPQIPPTYSATPSETAGTDGGTTSQTGL